MDDVLYTTHPAVLRPGEVPEVRPREVALMFSGGLDSTATAMRLAEQYDRVHLVTFKNGYGHFRHKRSRKRAEEISRSVGGDKFTFTLISTRDWFDRVVVRSLAGERVGPIRGLMFTLLS